MAEQARFSFPFPFLGEVAGARRGDAADRPPDQGFHRLDVARPAREPR